MGRIKVRKESKYKRRRAVVVMVIALAILLVTLGIKQRNVIKKLALSEDALEIGEELLNLSKVLSDDPNPPAVRSRYDTYKMEWKFMGNNNC